MSIESSTKKRLHLQGYSQIADVLLNEYKHGIRFAYLGCGATVLAGLVTQSVAWWYLAMAVALLAVVLPRHPFDYIYNSVVSKWINKPGIPNRTIENKFACGIATVWLAAVVMLFSTGEVTTANVLVGLLLLQAFAVGTIDFCVPSMIYRALFGRKSEAQIQ